MSSKKITLSLFCGGRGCSSILRELLNHSQFEVNLLVNAYDDGLSTGELRLFIPGMLGPSDFRKNLSYLLDFYSTQQFALAQFLEYRLPLDFTPQDATEFESYVRGKVSSPPKSLKTLFSSLEKKLIGPILQYLQTFFDFYHSQAHKLQLIDCALGNLLFAGAYLTHNRDFNQAAKSLARLFGSKANLINVSQGENRILVALKEDGEFLDCEAKIVGKQSPVKISEIFLLSQSLTLEQKNSLKQISSLEGKKQFLRGLEVNVNLSAEAKDAIGRSDIIVYGPGTQFSSLLPSYKTIGIKEELKNSKALLKVFVVNVAKDEDIQSFTANDIVDKALEILGESSSAASTSTSASGNLMTHVLYNENSQSKLNGVTYDPSKLSAQRQYRGIDWVLGNFENPVKERIHSGSAVCKAILSLYDEKKYSTNNELDIYIDLNQRSLAVDQLVQEFLELNWKRHFSKVHLCVNHPSVKQETYQDYLEVRSSSYSGLFSEVQVFLQWLKSGKSEYFATLTGDGGYRLRDILSCIQLLKEGSFGAIYGSRNQSRRQFVISLGAAYGESKLLYLVSWMGAFVLSLLFWIRFNLIFSDPLTGFRIYRRRSLLSLLSEEHQLRLPSHTTASGLTRILVKNGVELAEVPVSYRTFKGFTNVRWRLKRGLLNVRGAFFVL